jgi:outer membrane protein TolC
MKYFYLKIEILKHNYKKYNKIHLIFLFFFISCYINGQTNQDTLPANVTLSQCITFALSNQELIKQSLIDEEITRRDIRIALSGWYPQLEVDANIQKYFQIPTGPFPIYNYTDPSGFPAKYISSPTTANYLSSGSFSATQTLYSNALFFAARTSKNLKVQANENTEFTKINTYVDVTKAFFDVLVTEEQLDVLNEDIQRLERNYKDAYSLYQDGITDNIDYQRAEIDLSNSQAQKKSTEEAIKGKYSVLKHLIGVPPEKQLTILYDSSKLENDILYDTTAQLDYNNRIEYKQLQTSLTLQSTQINYYKWSFLPTLSAFYNYNPLYENSQLSDLYNTNYQSSFLGLKLSLPLFQGTSRLQNLSKSKLQYRRLQIGMDYLKSQINSEHTQALASYISNLNDLQIVKKNVAIAKNIYSTVKFQYEKGIKAYLEVIISETDLRSSELNYLNLLFQVLTSKLELERTSGVIPLNAFQGK